jgi:hypothetical protein
MEVGGLLSGVLFERSDFHFGPDVVKGKIHYFNGSIPHFPMLPIRPRPVIASIRVIFWNHFPMKPASLARAAALANADVIRPK